MKPDYQIQQEVIHALNAQQAISPWQIGVAVKNGVVCLYGEVNNFEKKLTAERIVQKVTGVQAIAEGIKVVVPGCPVTDLGLACHALEKLHLCHILPGTHFNMKIEDGVISIACEAPSEYQRTAAINALKDLPSVKWVIDEMAVSCQVVTAAV